MIETKMTKLVEEISKTTKDTNQNKTQSTILKHKAQESINRKHKKTLNLNRIKVENRRVDKRVKDNHYNNRKQERCKESSSNHLKNNNVNKPTKTTKHTNNNK